MGRGEEGKLGRRGDGVEWLLGRGIGEERGFGEVEVGGGKGLGEWEWEWEEERDAWI